ncbi:MAG: hypothetical protein JRH11_13000 [Deltaproteobacteria bacterium]|nr:hypothetical protein [Deltaproteobacteria bacterium]
MCSRSSQPALLTALLASCVTLLACGDDAAPVSDAGTDAGADADRVAAPPEIPWLADGVPPIMLAPCPDGWREVTGDSVLECDPYPEGGPETCGPGEAHFPGEAACRPIGDACPTGDYATTLPTDGTVLYVNPTASAGGDGSLAAPYAGLAEVRWISLAAGTTVALAKGTYEGTLPVRGGVRVVGACARDTVITGVDGPVQAVVTVASAGERAEVHNLTIAPLRQSAVVVRGGREAMLTGVLIDGAQFIALSVVEAGSVLTIEDSVVRDTRPSPANGTLGRALDVEGGGRIEASRVVLERNREVAAHAGGEGSALVLSDVAIRDTMAQSSDGVLGRAVNLQFGARLDASRLLVTGNRDTGLYVGEAGTMAELVDVIIRDTESQESDGAGGRGISVVRGATVSGARVLVAQNRELGIYVKGTGTTLSLVDSVIRDTAPQLLRNEAGRAVNVQAGARFDALRVLFASSHEVGIYARDPATTVSLTDSVVRDTESAVGSGVAGRGIETRAGARLEGLRLLVTRNRDVGILVAGVDVQAVLTDVVVRDTAAGRSAVVAGGTGVHVQTRARLEGERLEIDGAEMAGLTVAAGSFADVSDLSIFRIEPPPCATPGCEELLFGYGASCIGSEAHIRRFEIRGARLCGVFVAPGGSFRIRPAWTSTRAWSPGPPSAPAFRLTAMISGGSRMMSTTRTTRSTSTRRCCRYPG